MWGVQILASYSPSIVNRTGSTTVGSISRASLGSPSIPELIPQYCHWMMSVLGARDDTVNMIYCAPNKELPHTASALCNIDQKLPKVQIKQTFTITGGPWGPGVGHGRAWG